MIYKFFMAGRHNIACKMLLGDTETVFQISIPDSFSIRTNDLKYLLNIVYETDKLFHPVKAQFIHIILFMIQNLFRGAIGILVCSSVAMGLGRLE